MKKCLMVAALMFFLGTAASAQISFIPEVQVPSAEEVEDGYKVVKLEELNENIQITVRTLAEAYEVNKLEYNEELKMARVTVDDRENRVEKMILINEEGEEVE